MKLGSLFDGSGTAPLAATMYGIEPVWCSEIEPYPIAVTHERFPAMKHLGDISKIHGDEIEPVDILVGGSPCQDLSIAGKQKGLIEGNRSNLFFEMIRIIKEMRQSTNGEYPKYVIWENVPGAFSSNNGEDFLAVLQSFAQIADPDVHVPRPESGGAKLRWKTSGSIVADSFSIAWRTMDAQYFGVPQRRRRIYLVASYSGISDGNHRNEAIGHYHLGRAAEILFERKSMSGNPEPGEEARQGAADHVAGGAGGSGHVECLNPWDSQTIRQYGINGVCPTLSSNCSGGQNRQGICYKVSAFMGGQGSKAGGLGYAEEIAPTIKSVMSGGNTVPDVVYTIQGNVAERNARQNGCGVSENITPTLNSVDRHSVVYPEAAMTLTAEHDSSPCVDRGQNVVAIDCRNLNANIEISGTLQAKTNGGQSLNFQNPVVYDARGNGDGSTVPTLTGDHQNRVTDYTAICIGNGQLHNISMAEQMNTLDCMHDQQAIITNGKPPRRYIVRRLTPLECCRLQGFPDGYADIALIDDMTDDQVSFWEHVRETYSILFGKKYKPFKDKDALVKWYNKLHTDSAEYKMWGNGMCYRNMAFILNSILEVEQYLNIL